MMTDNTSPFGKDRRNDRPTLRSEQGAWHDDRGWTLSARNVTPVRTLAADEVAVSVEHVAAALPFLKGTRLADAFEAALREALDANFAESIALTEQNSYPAEPTPQPALTADQARRMAEGAQRIYDARHPAEPTAEDEHHSVQWAVRSEDGQTYEVEGKTREAAIREVNLLRQDEPNARLVQRRVCDWHRTTTHWHDGVDDPSPREAATPTGETEYGEPLADWERELLASTEPARPSLPDKQEVFDAKAEALIETSDYLRRYGVKGLDAWLTRRAHAFSATKNFGPAEQGDTGSDEGTAYVELTPDVSGYKAALRRLSGKEIEDRAVQRAKRYTDSEGQAVEKLAQKCAERKVAEAVAQIVAALEAEGRSWDECDPDIHTDPTERHRMHVEDLALAIRRQRSVADGENGGAEK